MRLAQLEATRVGKLFGVPGHVWRSLVSESAQALITMRQGREAEAFAHQCAAWSQLGFIRERVQSFVDEAGRSIVALCRRQSVRIPRVSAPPR
jgi:hypothetical protein